MARSMNILPKVKIDSNVSRGKKSLETSAATDIDKKQKKPQSTSLLISGPSVGGKNNILETSTPDPKKSKIKIIAKIDIGFGNYLFLRGDGCGLTWDKGSVMRPVGDNQWEWECSCDMKKICFEFKFLINDNIWSLGENFVALGQINEIVPAF